MSKTCVIIQPCFFPWRGQFDLFSRGEAKVFLDDVQYVRRSWYNRNKIFLQNTVQWISVPVKSKGCYHENICDILIDNSVQWRRKLKNSLSAAYGRYPHFQEFSATLFPLLDEPWEHLAQLSAASMRWAAQVLHMSDSFVFSSALHIDVTDPVERLIHICRSVQADTYISGPAAKDYIGAGTAFDKAGLRLEWMSYPAYPAYPRPGAQPDEELSVLDLIFCTGSQAPNYIWAASKNM